MNVARQVYPDRDTLMRGLAELVGDQLRAAHASKGRATLAVPGGTTPGPFLDALSESDLEWAGIDVMATDERRVSETSSRSNASLIRGKLLRNRATEAPFVRFDTAATDLSAFLPIDVLVLGMGDDMHTASLFPDAPEIAEALAPDAADLVTLRPPGQPEARLSLSGRVLRAASVIHILITGPDKRAALDRALGDGPATEAPIRVVLDAPGPVTVHHAD